jgi:hypothetical protein
MLTLLEEQQVVISIKSQLFIDPYLTFKSSMHHHTCTAQLKLAFCQYQASYISPQVKYGCLDV